MLILLIDDSDTPASKCPQASNVLIYNSCAWIVDPPPCPSHSRVFSGSFLFVIKSPTLSHLAIIYLAIIQRFHIQFNFCANILRFNQSCKSFRRFNT